MFRNSDTADSLGITGDEVFDVILPADLKPRQDVTLRVTKDGVSKEIIVQCRIDTPVEIDYYKNGGILQTVLRSILERSKREVRA
jgi:aconitate hydratase